MSQMDYFRALLTGKSVGGPPRRVVSESRCLAQGCSCPSFANRYGRGTSARSNEHTPGPWTVEQKSWWPNDTFPDSPNWYVRADNGVGGGYIVTPLGDGTSNEDARLIAAAPDLLKAVQRLLDMGQPVNGVTDKARAAVAKATGDA